jgi:hypothetical protein
LSDFFQIRNALTTFSKILNYGISKESTLPMTLALLCREDTERRKERHEVALRHFSPPLDKRRPYKPDNLRYTEEEITETTRKICNLLRNLNNMYTKCAFVCYLILG